VVVYVKKILLGSAFVLSAFSAQAADMAPAPYYKAPVPVAVCSWCGFYIGGNAGYTWSNQDSVTVGAASPTFIVGAQLPGSVGVSREGFIGGGQIGYNWQWTPSWVLGFEADFQGASTSNTTTVHVVPPAPFFPTDTSISSKLESLGTVRGRIGFLPQANWLVYFTGGLAYGQVQTSATLLDEGGPGVAPFAFTGSASSMKTGWTLGGGVEWAWTRTWSVKAEYLYYDLGTTTVAMPLATAIPFAGAGSFAANFNNTGSIVRAGINYHF
jgi:outer membrane immunogenic protein